MSAGNSGSENVHQSRALYDDVAEETPTMRSIPMAVGSPSILGSDHFGSKQLSRYGKSSLEGLKLPQKPVVDSSFGIKKEWTGFAPSPVWKVDGKKLELLTADFPLERTHREINEDASVVAERVSDVLRELSIETEFDCEKAKAKCTTNDYVCFRIRLFAGNESGQPVIVEVQRRNGSSHSFMRCCRAILEGAEGAKNVRRHLSVPSYLKKPISQMKCLQSIPPPVAVQSNPLENILSMLRSSNRDTNVLGLESLVFLTDPLKTDPAEALRASQSVIRSDDVREEIRALIDRDVFVTDDEELSGHADQLRHLSLCVMANVLAICSKDGCLVESIAPQTWFTEHLIPSLLDEIKRAEVFANDAFQACCCIRSLLSCSLHAKTAVIENKGLMVLDQAHTFGVRRHELLALEAGHCLDMVTKVSDTTSFSS